MRADDTTRTRQSIRVNLLCGHGTNRRYGLGCRCCSCRAARAVDARAQRAAHRDNERARAATYGASHKAERAAYLLAHRDEIAASRAVYNAAHKAERAAARAAYYAAHRDEEAAHAAAWKARHPIYHASYRDAHKATRSAYNREYKREHPEAACASSHRRRAQKLNAPGTHTAVDVVAQYERQHGRCYWCGKKLGKTYHTDHVIPLILGGSDGPENIVVACPFCNCSKGTKHPMDYAGRLL